MWCEGRMSAVGEQNGRRRFGAVWCGAGIRTTTVVSNGTRWGHPRKRTTEPGISITAAVVGEKQRCVKAAARPVVRTSYHRWHRPSRVEPVSPAGREGSVVLVRCGVGNAHQRPLKTNGGGVRRNKQTVLTGQRPHGTAQP